MAVQSEKDAALKGMIKKAAIYPIVICIVAVVVVVIMLLFVIPTFESMFADLGTELPAITKMVLAASEFIQGKWYIIFAVLIGAGVGLRFFSKTRIGRYTFGKLAMKLPLISNMSIKSASARMLRTMATLLASGISVIDALGITSNAMTNIYFREALETAKEEVSVGMPLSESIKRSGVFPSMVHHMIRIGEDSGNIDGMLTSLADYYEDEVEQTTQQLMAALEPMIILLLAGIVGTIIMAVLMPMTQMYSSMDNL